MKLIWMSLVVTIFVYGMKEDRVYNSLDDVPSLADNKSLKKERKFEEEKLSKNGMEENSEFKNIDFSKANLYEETKVEDLKMRGKIYEEMFVDTLHKHSEGFLANKNDEQKLLLVQSTKKQLPSDKTLDKDAMSLTQNNHMMNSEESKWVQNLNFDDYMQPFTKVICNSCKGRIFKGQLYIGQGTNKNHAICEAGYGGYEYSFSRMGTSQKKVHYNKFQNALLKIFKSLLWVNTDSYDHIDFIWNQMRIEGFTVPVEQRTANYLIFHVRKMRKDIAYCLRKYKGEEVYWYIHRSNWPKPKDVNWKAYIVEILKVKGAIPMIDFADWNWKEEIYVPWKLLYFIKEYTNYSSFERAVRDIPNVEIFYCDKHSRLFMRLKDMPYSLITQPKLKKVQNDRTKEQTIQFLKEKRLTDEQINALLAKTSQTEKLDPIVEYAVNFVKRVQKSDKILSEETLTNFMMEKGLTKEEIKFVFTKTSQTHVSMTAYSTINPDEIEFKFQGKYTGWTPPEKERKNEATNLEESLSEINSLFDDNIYQENSVIDDLSNQTSPARNSSKIKKHQI